MEEQITQVDRNDNVIGVLPKSLFFRSEYIHRGVHLILRDGSKILLQKRSPSKKLRPNVYTFAVGGTVAHDSSLEDNLHRECLEEIGVDYTFDFLFKIYCEDEYNRSREYIYEALYNGEKLKMEEGKIVGLDRFDIDELKQMILEQSPLFAPGIGDMLKQYFVYIGK